jgi:hypothetical protein
MTLNSFRRAVCATALAVGAHLSAPCQTVFPNQLEGTRSFELGELLLLLMPDRGSRFVGWDHRADSAILWVTAGIQSGKAPNGDDRYRRDGIVRVSNEGEIAQVLKERKVELGWTVTYINDSSPKFGVDKIFIGPGTPTEVCFGSTFDGCWFDVPFKSLVSVNIKARSLCSTRRGADAVRAFELSHQDRRPTVMLWSESGGSGGMSSDLALMLNTKPASTICTEILPDSKPMAKVNPAQSTAPKTFQRVSQNPVGNSELPKKAGSVTYDVEAMQKAEMLQHQMVNVAVCMRTASGAMLRSGIRDKETIVSFAVNACGPVLVKYLVPSTGFPDKDATTVFARTMAERELMSIPGVK